MSKIILRLEGGLGNQLFQYAFARMVQQKYGGVIKFDLHTYKKDKQRSLSLDHFVLNSKVDRYTSSNINILISFLVRIPARLLHVLLLKTIKNKYKRTKLLALMGVFIQENPRYYNTLFTSSAPVKFIAGYYMSEKFFSSIIEVLKKELIVKTKPTQVNRKMIDRLKHENSVCVHIRRGDYINTKWADKNLVCDFDYYEKAINFINSKVDSPKFYIFSNTIEDIKWIKSNYCFSLPMSYIDLNNPDYEDFRLMMNCKHFVLSNSTFSWWVSYLANNAAKIVVAPSKWNNDVYDQSDIYLEDWHLIDVE